MSRQITKNQHYVPQTYLSNWECLEQRGNLYSYDTKNKYPQRRKAICSICSSEYGYELKTRQGDIVALNLFEKRLGSMETYFDTFYKKLECFALRQSITEEEKEFWIQWIVLQILRHPKIIKGVEQKFREDSLLVDSYVAHEWALLGCLDVLFPKINITDNIELTNFISIHKGKSFWYLCNIFYKLDMKIAVNKQCSFITTDNPVVGLGNFDIVVFPISPKFCFILSKIKQPYNTTFFITDSKMYERIIAIMVTDPVSQYIYSKQRFNEDEMEFINALLARKFHA